MLWRVQASFFFFFFPHLWSLPLSHYPQLCFGWSSTTSTFRHNFLSYLLRGCCQMNWTYILASVWNPMTVFKCAVIDIEVWLLQILKFILYSVSFILFIRSITLSTLSIPADPPPWVICLQASLRISLGRKRWEFWWWAWMLLERPPSCTNWS